eukprot:scaffold120169_cov23-Prasinocladus_malaysianus.AAC.1
MCCAEGENSQNPWAHGPTTPVRLCAHRPLMTPPATSLLPRARVPPTPTTTTTATPTTTTRSHATQAMPP